MKVGLPVGKYRGENSPKWKGGRDAKNARRRQMRKRLHLCLSCSFHFEKTFGTGSTNKYCDNCINTISMCLYCLTDFTIKQKDIDDGRGKFCSRRCALASYALNPLKGEKMWNWKGGINNVIARRARLRGAIGSHINKQWEEMKKKYNYMCLCCKQQEPFIKLEEDHIIPLSCEGSNDISNIQPLCRSCNARKSTKSTNYVK